MFCMRHTMVGGHGRVPRWAARGVSTNLLVMVMLLFPGSRAGYTSTVHVMVRDGRRSTSEATGRNRLRWAIVVSHIRLLLVLLSSTAGRTVDATRRRWAIVATIRTLWCASMLSWLKKRRVHVVRRWWTTWTVRWLTSRRKRNLARASRRRTVVSTRVTRWATRTTGMGRRLSLKVRMRGKYIVPGSLPRIGNGRRLWLS
mmetsp:Transcript_14291/g.30705  ORF Transcript_14291/g.30705 Transcript_14291/m.30705 type:complete len:200 (-) Transcript_14291:320-919(-)